MDSNDLVVTTRLAVSAAGLGAQVHSENPHSPPVSPCFSHMFCSPNHIASDLIPIYAFVKLLINKSAYCNVVPPYEIETMAHLRAWFGVVCWSNDALDSVVEDYVRYLIARQQRAN